MNTQIGIAPKKPFPIAGIFLILFSVCNIILTFFNTMPLDITMGILISVSALVLSIVLFATKSGVAVTIVTALLAAWYTIYFWICFFNSFSYIPMYIDWLTYGYDPVYSILGIISSVTFISRLMCAFLPASACVPAGSLPAAPPPR